MNNCEVEKHYICHSEKAVATEESISSVIPAKAEVHLSPPINLSTDHPITPITYFSTWNLEPLNFERFGTAKHTPIVPRSLVNDGQFIYETA